MDFVGLNKKEDLSSDSTNARKQDVLSNHADSTALTHAAEPTIALTPYKSNTPTPLMLQRALTKSNHDDSYEQEADSVADQVMRMSDATLGLQTERSSNGHLSQDEQRASEPMAVQPSGAVQESATSYASHAQGIISSPGEPLDAGTRSFMEARFGRDLSNVRVHTDAEAAESTENLNAQAYTVGRDIVFGLGQYAPASTSGRHLIAHEVSHVIQQEHSSPSIQRQPKKGINMVNIPKVKKVFEANATPEVLALYKKIDLTKTTAQEIMKTMINGTTHVWDINLSFENRTGGSVTKAGTQTTDPKRGEVHPITTEIAILHTPAEMAEIPSSAPVNKMSDAKERGIYICESVVEKTDKRQIE